MAHFAQLDENNIVINIIVIHNNEMIDENGEESENKGILFCQSLYGTNTNWIQTSYNNKFRCRYAAIGSTYDVFRDAFINIKPYESWVLNELTLDWDPPTPYPSDGKRYAWDEESLNWILLPSINL